jgi:hypothetical protein
MEATTSEPALSRLMALCGGVRRCARVCLSVFLCACVRLRAIACDCVRLRAVRVGPVEAEDDDPFSRCFHDGHLSNLFAVVIIETQTKALTLPFLSSACCCAACRAHPL